jgi:transposase
VGLAPTIHHRRRVVTATTAYLAASSSRQSVASVVPLRRLRRVYLACGVTDMRKGAVGLAMLVQQSLAENPFDGSVYAFRGRRSGLIKLIWHDGIGLCMLTKRLERGQFQWPSASTTGRIALTSSQLAALLDGCEWRAPAARQRPELVG